jgi:hypothetical protein
LIATVQNPLGRFNKADFSLAPFTVVVDPVRAGRLFKLESGDAFSEKVLYIYRKQLEEADVILINKIDLVTPEAVGLLEKRLAKEFSSARIFKVSARTGAGMDAWISAVMDGVSSERISPELDYQKLGEGEALLGSLNCAVQLSSLKGFRCNPILFELGEAIARELRVKDVQLAHLKMALAPEIDVEGVATLNLARSELQPDLGEELSEPVERGNLSVSLRAEGKPDALHAAVTNAMTHVWTMFPTIFARLTHMEHFRPSPSKPTHRFASARQ